jgi:hypothetical protein
LEATRKTFVFQRTKEPTHIRHEDQLPPEAYTDQDRRWRFPDASFMRGEKSPLPSLTDQDRTWRFPDQHSIRSSSTIEPYLDEERIDWVTPGQEFLRREDDFPAALQDEDRFWWKTGDFDDLLLEDDDEIPVVQPYMESEDRIFRKPSSKFIRHPHSLGEFEGEYIHTMEDDDRLSWLTESTERLLMEEGDLLGDDYVGTC